jgi:hypothetical protein
MIKTVNGSGRYMMVNGGMPSTTYMNTGSGYMGVGDLRFNSNSQNLEVYDGQRWMELNSSHASVGLTPEAERLLDWARMKMTEELELDALAEKNPTLSDLVEQKKALDHKIKMVQTLVR